MHEESSRTDNSISPGDKDVLTTTSCHLLCAYVHVIPRARGKLVISRRETRRTQRSATALAAHPVSSSGAQSVSVFPSNCPTQAAACVIIEHRSLEAKESEGILSSLGSESPLSFVEEKFNRAFCPHNCSSATVRATVRALRRRYIADEIARRRREENSAYDVIGVRSLFVPFLYSAHFAKEGKGEGGRERESGKEKGNYVASSRKISPDAREIEQFRRLPS